MEKICKSCGQRLNEKASFCSYCWSKYEEPCYQPGGYGQQGQQMYGPQGPQMFGPQGQQMYYGQPQNPQMYGPQNQPTYGPQNPQMYGPQGQQPYYGQPQYPQKKSKGGLIAFAIIMALITAGVATYFIMKDNGSWDRLFGSESVEVQDPGNDPGSFPGGLGTSAQPTAPSVPGIPGLDNGAAFDAFVGDWSGQFQFTKMEGYDTMPGAPSNVDDLIRQALSSPVNYTMSIREDRRWETYIDYMAGMLFDSSDMKADDPATEEEREMHLLKGPEDGMVYVDAKSMSPDGRDGGAVRINAYKGEDGEGVFLSGDFHMELYNSGSTVCVEGTFKVRPDAG